MYFCFVLVRNHRCNFRSSQIEFPTWASHLALIHLPLETLLSFSYNVLWWSLKIFLLKTFPNSEKVNSITIVIFDKWIHILYSLSLHGLIFKYNKVLKYLYSRGKVLVYNKIAKLTNFWKISHFSKTGDFLEKVGKSRDFLEKVMTFWKIKKSWFFPADFSS